MPSLFVPSYRQQATEKERMCYSQCQNKRCRGEHALLKDTDAQVTNYYSSRVKMRRCQKGLLSEETIRLNKEMDDLGVKELRSGRKNKRHKKSKTRMLGEREPWPENRLDPQGLQMFRQERWEAWSLKHRKETVSVSQNVGWLQNCLGVRWIADGNCGEAVWLSLQAIWGRTAASQKDTGDLVMWGSNQRAEPRWHWGRKAHLSAWRCRSQRKGWRPEQPPLL